MLECLSADDVQILLKRQTDTALKSQSLMYELLHISAPARQILD